MREVFTLAGYEYRKIFKRRSTWIALGIVLLWTLFSGFGSIFGEFYIEGEKVASHFQMAKTERKALENLEIKELNQEFFQRWKEDMEWFIKEQREQLFGEGAAGHRALVWEKYYESYAPYDNLDMLLASMNNQIGNIAIEEIGEMDFYKYRNLMLERIFEKEKLSPGEITFHKKENDKIKTPYAYGNMIGFDNIFRMLAPNCIFLAFAAAIIFAPLFAIEYTSNMDALVLSSRFGKNKLIWAKLLTGISFGLFSSIFFMGIFMLEIQAIYGLSGWNLPVQVSAAGLYLTLPINLLELLGIAIGCCTIAICMTIVVIMFCSAKMKSPFGVIIVGFAFIFIPVFLISMVADHPILFLITNSLPTSMMYPAGVTAHQLVSMGNRYFYFFQWVPVMYLCLMAGLSWWSYRIFQNHQVG
ncbi:hypothetical protein C806_00422 [Lachnospiraceae bacterium 3-1]|nr:hypothetical protein C806_00422 [Lachnospiraceae bacterium 3-1]